MELEGIMLSEISQVEKESIKWFHSSVEYNNKEKTEGYLFFDIELYVF